MTSLQLHIETANGSSRMDGDTGCGAGYTAE